MVHTRAQSTASLRRESQPSKDQGSIDSEVAKNATAQYPASGTLKRQVDVLDPGSTQKRPRLDSGLSQPLPNLASSQDQRPDDALIQPQPDHELPQPDHESTQPGHESPQLQHDLKLPHHQQADDEISQPQPDPQTQIQASSNTHLAAQGRSDYLINPVAHWVREGVWPKRPFQLDPQRLYAQKIPSYPSRAESTTSSDELRRKDNFVSLGDQQYVALLASKGSFMCQSDLGITRQSREAYLTLLMTEQTVPDGTLFQHDLFEKTYPLFMWRDKALIERYITPLIVPSAEILGIYGANHHGILVEGIHEDWLHSIPLVGPCPQPDYSVGFSNTAFSSDQFTKLQPYISDMLGYRSLFLSTHIMLFPFLSCQVVDFRRTLDMADRQNAHHMALAARGAAELFRAANRAEDAHRQILAFSVSHSVQHVRIYGHYPVFDGENITYYRHPIRKFDIVAREGRERWTAYRFIMNLYTLWMPSHLKKLRSAIDKLPVPLSILGSSSVEQDGHDAGSQSIV